MEMKKIGLCLAYTGTNYGQLLQAYATQQSVEHYGYTTEIIEYHSGSNKGIQPSFAAMYVAGKIVLSSIMGKIKRKKPIEYDERHRANDIERKIAADLFRSKWLMNIVRCDGITELRNRSEGYSAVLVGSDQLWLPDVSVSNFYTLRFAASAVTKISYATSLGVSTYPNYAKKPAADFWKKIDYLSVREQQGKDIIQSIVDLPVKVVADPTYLLTKEEWLERIPQKTIVENGYVLCYFLGDSEPMKNFAKKFAQTKGLRVVSILSNECNSDDFSIFDEVVTGKGPEEFINLIRNAEFVLTDSFHGLAFSVINEKQFYIFYRQRPEVKQSRNSRIDNIVRTWGLGDRLIADPAHAEISDAQINYGVVKEKVMALRAESLDFLRKSLNAGGHGNAENSISK